MAANPYVPAVLLARHLHAERSSAVDFARRWRLDAGVIEGVLAGDLPREPKALGLLGRVLHVDSDDGCEFERLPRSAAVVANQSTVEVTEQVFGVAALQRPPERGLLHGISQGWQSHHPDNASK